MVWSAATVAEEALRDIGVFSPYDIDPEPEDYAIALRRLDALVGYLAGTEEITFLQEIEQPIVLEVGKEDYNYNALLGKNLQFITQVFRTKDDKDRQQLDMLRLSRYNEYKADNEGYNEPCAVFIERLDQGTLKVWGVPNVAGYKLHLRGYRFSNNLLDDGGSVKTEFSKAWNLCLSKLLAYDIGGGAVTTMPRGDRQEVLAYGERMKRTLIAYNNEENVRKPRYTRYNDL